MARPWDTSLMAQLRHAKSLQEQAATLQALKNEVVGHLQKKEAWIGLGVLEPIVQTLASSPSSPSHNGKDASVVLPSRPLSDEDSVKLQAFQLVASFANGGPSFLHPLHAARVVPAVLSNISPFTSPPQIVVASLRALVDISTAASLAPPSSPLDVHTLADIIFVPHHIHSLHAMLSITSAEYVIQSQISLASTLISRLCREERHQNALSTGGVLDALASQLARFAVSDGLVVPGAEKLAKVDGLADVFPDCAPAGAKIGPVLEALGCILGDSKFRANRLVCSPALLAIFPSVKFKPPRDGPETHQQRVTAMDYILPSLPAPASATRARSTTQSVHPLPARSESRASSKASSNKLGAPVVWDAPRLTPSGSTLQATNEDAESPLIPWLIHLVRTLSDCDRLMAAAVLAALFRAGLGRKNFREGTIALLVVPVLIRIIAKYDKLATKSTDAPDATWRRILERGPAILARLTADSEQLQKAAYDCEATKVLARLLKRSYQPAVDVNQPKYWSPNPDTGMEVDNTSPKARLGDPGLNPALAHKVAVREACLKAVGALSAGNEEYRKALVAEDVVPYVVESLWEFPRKPRSGKDKLTAEPARNGPSPAFGTNTLAVMVAGCHVVRILARSVGILRTALVDHAVTLPIFHFLRHPDVNVQIAATATMINLVIEVSPVRELLTDYGVMKVLCEHAHSDNPALRLNALWALKHFVDAVGPDLKKSCLELLEPDWLMQVISDDSRESSLSALKAKEPMSDDFDEDMDSQPMDEPLRWLYSADGNIRELDASRSTRLRQAEDRLVSVRETESNPVRRARSDDVAIQEQGLDFIRNFIGCPKSETPSDSPGETVEMIDHLLTEVGGDRLFDILASKLRSKMLHPLSQRDPVLGRETRILHPQAKVIVAVICILVHIAASISRHRQLVMAQTELLKLLALQANSKDRTIRISLCHLIINLTEKDDEGEAQACSQRAHELKKLGFYTKMDMMKLQDRDSDIRERAKTATHQMEDATS